MAHSRDSCMCCDNIIANPAFAYMLIIGTPANAIIHSSGFVKSRDFLVVGAVMIVISFIVLLLIVNVYWIGILGL